MIFHNARGAVRPAALGVMALATILTLVCANRAAAIVTVPNAALFNLTVNAGADSPPQGLPSSTGSPTILTITNRTPQDGIRGIASFAANWISTAPQSMLWTGTARGVVVGGQTSVANATLANIGIGVNVLSDIQGGAINYFKIRNTSGIAVTINVHEVW